MANSLNSLNLFSNKRTIYLIDVIDDQSLIKFKQDLESIISADDTVVNENYQTLYSLDPKLAEYYKKNVKRPDIILDLSSPGGMVYEGLSIYDLLRKYNTGNQYKIICNASGIIASIASIIMLGCDERIASPNTTILIHQISTFVAGTLEDLKDDLKESERLTDIIRNIYYERTKLTKEILDEKDKMKKDWILSPQ